MGRLVAIGCALAACGHSYFDPEKDASRGGSDAAPSPANIAFVTSTTALPSTFGTNLSGADAMCMQRAQAAGLAGTFVAFLSTSTINARDRLAGSRGWVRTDGKPIFDTPDDIDNGTMYFPIDHDENGVGLSANQVVSGSSVTGDASLSTETCGDYTTASGDVMFGYTDSTTSDWIAIDNNFSCANPGRIYCFGLGKTAPLQIAKAPGRLAFVTVQPFVVDAGGLTTADTLCASEATSAGLPGTYKAMLATSTASAISRFSTAGATWVRLDGIPLATSAIAFAGAEFVAPLNVTSTGGYYPHQHVMTGGGSPSLIASGSTCADWTAVGGTGNVGLACSNGAMFASSVNTDPCNIDPIYCLQE